MPYSSKLKFYHPGSSNYGQRGCKRSQLRKRNMKTYTNSTMGYDQHSQMQHMDGPKDKCIFIKSVILKMTQGK